MCTSRWTMRSRPIGRPTRTGIEYGWNVPTNGQAGARVNVDMQESSPLLGRSTCELLPVIAGKSHSRGPSESVPRVSALPRHPSRTGTRPPQLVDVVDEPGAQANSRIHAVGPPTDAARPLFIRGGPWPVNLRAPRQGMRRGSGTSCRPPSRWKPAASDGEALRSCRPGSCAGRFRCLKEPPALDTGFGRSQCPWANGAPAHRPLR